jgi:hypothetical protein
MLSSVFDILDEGKLTEVTTSNPFLQFFTTSHDISHYYFYFNLPGGGRNP